MLKDLPRFRGDNPADAIFNFFEDLGWDKKRNLNALKVSVSNKDWKSFISFVQSFGKTQTERAKFGFACMNVGPAQDCNVPEGKVKLEEGWLC